MSETDTATANLHDSATSQCAVLNFCQTRVMALV